jgi:uncharacterized protein involved in exopolysaccharide biosynthesis
VTAYRETFRRHRRLLCLPIALATIVAFWSVVASPKSYESNASLWVDTGPGLDSSVANANPALPPPAEQEQSMVAELLKTRDFRLTVGREGPLGNYLATHSGRSWGPTSVLSALRGGDRLDHRIVSALSGKNVTTTIGGPQVLQISYTGPTPAVATGTLRSLLRELERKSSLLAESRSRRAVAFYRNQLNGAKKAVGDAREQATAYLAEHPAAVGATDPMLRALRQAQGQATARLARATTNFNLASGALQSPATSPSTIEVLDAPAVPTAPVSGKKKALLGIIGGLFAGALISFLGLVALTPGTPEAATPGFSRRPDGFSAETDAPEPEPLPTAEEPAGDVYHRIWEAPDDPAAEAGEHANGAGAAAKTKKHGAKRRTEPPPEPPSAADE